MTSEIETFSRKFCKLVGIEPREYWWCSHCLSEKSPVQVTYYEKCTYCGNHVERVEGPDFTDAREVIRVMREREDYDDFLRFIQRAHWFSDEEWIDLLCDTTGLLRDEAIKFLEERNA